MKEEKTRQHAGFCGTCDEILGKLIAAAERMTPEEKATLRANIRGRLLKIGDIILVSMKDGRVLRATVLAVFDSVAGYRVRCQSQSGDLMTISAADCELE